MATTTRRVLRQRVSEKVSDYQSLTTTSLGTSTTLISTGFLDLPGGSDDDGFLGFYEYQTSGNNENEFRRADLFTTSTNTLRVARAHTNAVANGVTFELHRFSPDDYHTAIRQAISDLFPHLFLPIRDETLLVDNLLLNPDFESAIAAGAHPSWTNVGAGITVTAETTILRHGSQSNKIVAGGGAAGQTTQTPTININEVTGKAVTFKMWVYATAASTARIRLDWDGTNFANSSYHSGNDQWELLSVAATVPSSATQVKAICEVAAAGTGYFDAGWLRILPVYRYTIPSTILRGPHYVSQQYDELDVAGPYYPIGANNGRSAGMRLRLEGMGLLTNPTTDTATIEIGAPQTDLLATQAARNLMLIQAAAPRAAQQQVDRYLAEAARYEQEVAATLGRPGVKMARLGAQEMKGAYHFEEDATARYLVLDQRR